MRVLMEFVLTQDQLEAQTGDPPPAGEGRMLLRQIAETIPLDGPPGPINTVLGCMLLLAHRGSLAEMRAFLYMLNIPHIHREMTVETYDMPHNRTRAVMVTFNITEHRGVSAQPTDMGKPISAPDAVEEAPDTRRPSLGGMSMRRRRR